MTASEYLAWERAQPERHEYCRGEVFSMAGGSPRHNALSAAIIRDLRVGDGFELLVDALYEGTDELPSD
ncbi:MAG: Uma2 family endonuclease [Myxococcales bacterium]|nr:Uma2 family endonuclease [Myxococcales bacterium]